MMQQRYDAEQQQRERQNAMQDNTLKARGLLNGGLLSGDIGPNGRTPEEMQAKHGFNPLPYLTQEELNYRTPEQKAQDALGLFQQKLKAENEARPPVPKANLKFVEMDGPEGPGHYVFDMDTLQGTRVGGRLDNADNAGKRAMQTMQNIASHILNLRKRRRSHGVGENITTAAMNPNYQRVLQEMQAEESRAMEMLQALAERYGVLPDFEYVLFEAPPDRLPSPYEEEDD
jgi:hypothetical protein